MRYDQLGGCGDGVFLVKWDDTSPISENASVSASSVVFQIWGGTPGITFYTSVGGNYEQLAAGVQDHDVFHDFSLVCEASAYTFLVDGSPIFGPVQSDIRPSALWLGNPTFSYSGCQDWAAFSVDYIRVEVYAPVPTQTGSWAALKALYR
jgi:hypothetical protein